MNILAVKNDRQLVQLYRLSVILTPLIDQQLCVHYSSTKCAKPYPVLAQGCC